MSTKKDEARFTIKFDPGNPHHLRAIEILNGVGRCKADKIADALCAFYRAVVIPASPTLARSCSKPLVHEATIAITTAEAQESSDTSRLDADTAVKIMRESAAAFLG